MTSHAFILGVLVAVPILVLIVRRFYITDTSRMTSETIGEVVRAKQRAVSDADQRRTETRVQVTYVVAGHDYQVTRIFPGERAVQYPAGRKLTVRYNPATPGMADLASK